jgi:predicted nuclease of predicted toxin-antitoxin system
MKLLLDQNISYRVIKQLRPYFEEIHYVAEFGLTDALDFKIWEFAKLNGFTVVTFDEDFYNIQLIKGFPPKIIWFKTGNISKQQFIDFLIAQRDMIHSFITSENYQREGCLELFLIRKE